MASLRSLFSHWRKARHSDNPHPHVVHLYFISNNGFSYHYLYGPCLLDEYKEVYEGG
jgi:hypothetical protein